MKWLRTVPIWSLLACGGGVTDAPSDTSPRLAIVRGMVTLTDGDCMPITTPERCRVSTPVVTVQAFPVIELVDGELPHEPSGTVVAEIRSAPDGTFEMSLPEGRYTLLTHYEGEWYPRRWTSDGEWAPIEVNQAWVETARIDIYRASS